MSHLTLCIWTWHEARIAVIKKQWVRLTYPLEEVISKQKKKKKQRSRLKQHEAQYE
jgi:hypothetical protein